MKLFKILRSKYDRMLKKLETVEDKINITYNDIEKTEYKIKEQLLNLYTNHEKIVNKLDKKKYSEIKEELNESLNIHNDTIDKLKKKLDSVLESKKYLSDNKTIIIARIECYSSLNEMYKSELFPQEMFDKKSIEKEIESIKEKVDDIKFQNTAYSKLLKDLK